MLSFENDIVIFYCHTYAEEELYEGKHGGNVGGELPGYGTDTGGHGGLEKWQKRLEKWRKKSLKFKSL